MEEDGVQRCGTCPAFAVLRGEGGAGTCRSAPPVVLQAEKYFAGRVATSPTALTPQLARSRWCARRTSAWLTPRTAA